MSSERKYLRHSVARSSGAENILLFHCISSYPAPLEESNLNMIPVIRDKFDVEVGLSDHTLSNMASVIAVSKGAVAIEKHFIIDKSLKGPDSEFSMDPKQLKDLVSQTNQAWMSLGNSNFKRAEVEKPNLAFRRSIYFTNNLKKGDVITNENIRRIRPGYGLKPKYYSEILGKKVTKDIERGEPVKWDLIES